MVSRSLGTYIEGSGAPSHVAGKTGGRLNAAGGADSDEDGTIIECAKNLIEIERSLTKPADVRADFAPAGAAWNLAGRFVKRGVRERREGTGVATALEEFTVHVENALRARLLVKIVDVLRAEKKAVLQIPLESSEGQMAGIWLGGGCDFAPHGIEIPDEARIAPPGER